MIRRVPRVALWCAGVHLLVAGGILGWLLTLTPFLIQHEMPVAMVVGLNVLTVADYPAIWLTEAANQYLHLLPPVAIAVPLLLGTIQWFLIGIGIHRAALWVRSARP